VSDIDVLTLRQALDFTTDVYVTEKIFETQQNIMFVEIQPELLMQAPEEFLAYSESVFSLNLITVGILSKPHSKDFSSLLNGFDILIAPIDDGVSIEVADLDRTIENLSLCVTRNPQAAIVLAQLLRQEAFNDVGKGLALESFAYAMLQSGPEHALWLTERGQMPQLLDKVPAVDSIRTGSCLDIFLNRPERANAFSSRMRDELFEILQIAFLDESIESVSLRGKGNSFCSGGELAEFGLVTSPPDGHLIRLSRNPGMSVHRLSEKIIVYLHGACAGAGIEIPSFASKVVIDESANIFLPEVSMGLIPGAGGTVSIPRRIGRQRTAYLAMSGEQVLPEVALRWGLVDELLSVELWD
jgi:enoyl-CoA hydratase/carnithine racemase